MTTIKFVTTIFAFLLLGACAPKAVEGPPIRTYRLVADGVDELTLRSNLNNFCNERGYRCWGQIFPVRHGPLLFVLNKDDVQVLIGNEQDENEFRVGFHRIQGRPPKTEQEIERIAEELRPVLIDLLDRSGG